LKSDDSLACEVQENGKFIVYKAEAVDVDYLSALDGTLSEWHSAEDDKAYRNL
jgi:hypothetical protein